jgi:PncC family amidohydrolase
MMSKLLPLLDILRQKKYSIGFAESCTGGLLSATFAEVAGVSDVFMGSVVSYSNAAKEDLLHVRPETLQRFGAVSEEAAREMAQGALQALKVKCAIAITGIAGPTGGSKSKPVGTVFFAICGPDFEKAKKEVFAGSRIEIQRQSVQYGIQFLYDQLLSGMR